jgi:AAA+ ATPase superfamily predicted ATPase
MALTQVSFEDVKLFWENWRGGVPISHEHLNRVEKAMITFEQVTQIEAKRRQIEQLQDQLNNQAKATHFAIADDVGQKRVWIEQASALSPFFRETMCKITVAQILRLLDESERLGVDVTTSKQSLLNFLEGLKQKEPAAEGPVS